MTDDERRRSARARRRLAGRYTIEAPISRGAMGEVYRAAATSGEPVAIKRLLDVRQAARFEIEARLLARLQHPRIARVTRPLSGREGSYLVMELVDGADLGEVLSRARRPGPAGRARRSSTRARRARRCSTCTTSRSCTATSSRAT